MINPLVFRMRTAVSFGCGTIANIAKQMEQYSGKKVLIITDEGIRKAGLLKMVQDPVEAADYQTRVYDQVELDPSLESIEVGAEFMKQDIPDIIIAVGGGSAMDAAKGYRVVVENGGSIRDYLGANKVPSPPKIPLICVPTTAGTGSEVTEFSVLSDQQSEKKSSVLSPFIAAELAILDPCLMSSAPPYITATAGIDAFGHAVESYISYKADPITDAWSLAAVEIIAKNLRTAYANGRDMEARTNMAMGSLLAGMAFNSTQLGAAHSLGTPLSGMFHVNHGVTIGLLLPPVLRYNMLAAMPKLRNIANVMGVNTINMTDREASLAAIKEIELLVGDIGLPLTLGELNLNIDDEALKKMAPIAMTHGMIPCNIHCPSAEDFYLIFKEIL